MRLRFTICLAVLLLSLVRVSAQNKDNEIPFRMSVRATATVPHSLSNKAFRRSFTGIYDITAHVDYQVLRGFVVGLQYRNNLWKTADNKIPGLNTYAQSHHAGIRVGYDHPLSQTSTAYFGIAAEQGFVKFYGLSIVPGTDVSHLKTVYDYHTIELDGGVFFYTEGSFAIGVHSSVVMTNYHFNPYSIFLNQHKAYIASDLNGTWSHLDFGFEIVYSFWRKGGGTSGE